MRDAFVEDAGTLVDHREQQALDNVLWLEHMPGPATLEGGPKYDPPPVFIGFGRARARFVEVETAPGLLAEAPELAQLIGDRRAETFRLAHAPADVETGEIAHGERPHREP